MSGKNKKTIILNKIGKNLNFYDRILVKILKNYTLKVYRMGLNDYFNWERKDYKKTERNSRG